MLQNTQGTLTRTADAVEAINAARGTGGSNVTSVGDSATSVTLLAAQASRKGATFYNDSTAILYIKCGATASTSSYTTQLAASGGYWELPALYVGVVDGIWASDAGGNVRVTEFV